MILAVQDGNVFENQGIDTFQACDIERVQIRIRPPLMMGVDATPGAEIVPGRVCIELIKAQYLFAFIDRQILESGGGHDRAAPPAHRAVTTTWLDQSILEPHGELDAAAVTLPFMQWADIDFIDKRLFTERILHTHSSTPGLS
jgi:hypothetical protein